MSLPDTPRFKRIERLAADLRRELELGIHMGEIAPGVFFEIFVRRSDDAEILKGTFTLAPWKRPGAA